MPMSNFVKTLNGKGCRRFAEFVRAAKLNPAINPPLELLDDPETSCELQAAIPITGKIFPTRYDLGSHLHGLLSCLEARHISRDQGLWNWLSLYYFDQLWTPVKGDERRLGEEARYVLPEKYNYNKYYRHLLREAWNFVRLHGELARVVLDSPLYVRGEIAEQLGSRQWTAGNGAIIAAAGRLFIDPKTRAVKRGVSGKDQPGTARRLSDVIQQFDRTYDLQACDAEKIFGLLPNEFDRWKPSGAQKPAQVAQGTNASV